MNKSDQNAGGELDQTPRTRRRVRAWVLGTIVVVLLGLIAAQGLFNLWAFVPAETGADTLLLYALSTLNFVAFFVFTFILLRSLLRLRRERRARQPGSRIQTRLLVYFIGLSLLPITAMAAFSYLFLNRSVEKWMGRLPENVVERVRQQQREIAASAKPKTARNGDAAGNGDSTKATSRMASDFGRVARHRRIDGG